MELPGDDFNYLVCSNFSEASYNMPVNKTSVWNETLEMSNFPA